MYCFLCCLSQVKAAFTRAYNKQCPSTPYSVVGGSARKSRPTPKMDDEMMEEGGGVVEADEEGSSDDDVSVAMVKKKPGKDAAKSSRGSGRGRGKSRKAWCASFNQHLSGQ